MLYSQTYVRYVVNQNDKIMKKIDPHLIFSAGMIIGAILWILGSLYADYRIQKLLDKPIPAQTIQLDTADAIPIKDIILEYVWIKDVGVWYNVPADEYIAILDSVMDADGTVDVGYRDSITLSDSSKWYITEKEGYWLDNK